MTTEYVKPLRRLDPHPLQRLQHPLRRLHLDDKRLSGLQQALEAGQDRWPALTAAGEDVVVDRPVVRLNERQPHCLARPLDLIGSKRWTQPLVQLGPI